jgi:hypothetical protein
VLSENKKKKIKEEEIFRNQIRIELEAKGVKNTFWTFINSPFILGF